MALSTRGGFPPSHLPPLLQPCRCKRIGQGFTVQPVQPLHPVCMPQALHACRVWKYFTGEEAPELRRAGSGGGNAFQHMMSNARRGNRVVRSDKPPLYFQHEVRGEDSEIEFPSVVKQTSRFLTGVPAKIRIGQGAVDCVRCPPCLRCHDSSTWFMRGGQGANRLKPHPGVQMIAHCSRPSVMHVDEMIHYCAVCSQGHSRTIVGVECRQQPNGEVGHMMCFLTMEKTPYSVKLVIRPWPSLSAQPNICPRASDGGATAQPLALHAACIMEHASAQLRLCCNFFDRKAPGTIVNGRLCGRCWCCGPRPAVWSDFSH